MIKLIKTLFNPHVAAEIRNGVYQFIYLSPEIFLNSQMWDKIYFSLEFQEQLPLILVNEAHMIYVWGLVESRKALKKCSVYGCHQDSSIF